MEEYTLPHISQETREKLASYGFKNHLYDYLELPSIYVPRAKGFDSYTYLIMGLSAVGGVLAKSYRVDASSFICAFIAAPFMSFIQKKEADTVYNSEYSKRHPSIVLQQFPILNQSYKQVSSEIDAEILKSNERIRLLEERKHRTNI